LHATQNENDHICKRIRQSVKKWQLERKSTRKEIHLPAKSQDCDILQFGNI